MLHEYISKTVNDMNAIASDILNIAKQRLHANEVALIALSGDMGSGKTTLVQACARVFGITNIVTSPTFVIMKKYAIPSNDVGRIEMSRTTRGEYPQWQQLVHVDAYRLEHALELLALGFQKELDNHNNITMIEWPENVSDVFKNKKHIYIECKFIDEETRQFHVTIKE